MQPVINIIYELSKNYIDAYFASHQPTGGFFARPVSGNPDWDKSQLAATTAWQIWDISGMVPAGTTAILCNINCEADTTFPYLRIAPYYIHLWDQIARIRIPKSNMPHEPHKIIPIDDNLKFETRSNVVAASWTNCNISIVGYWRGAIVGFQNRGDPAVDDFTESDFPAFQTWTDLDLSGIIPAHTSVVFLCCRVWSSNSQRSLRFRTKGHSNAINISRCEAVQSGLNYYYDIQVPTNALQTIQYWSSLGEDPVVRATVKGWLF